MDKKKILIVASGFYPEQSPRAFRATELAKELCRQGHEVSIIIPEKENLQPLIEEFPITLLSLGKMSWKIPCIKGMGRMGALFNKIVNRLLPLLFAFPQIELFFKVKRKLKAVGTTYDAVISIAVPHPIHWGVAAVWSNNKKKNIAPVWIADCGDPYYIQENDTYQPPFYFKWVEEWFMRKVDCVTVPTQTSYKGYFKEFHSKIKVIPQGFRWEDIVKQEVINDGVIRFGYGGSFALHRRDPKELLEFLTKIDESVQFEFHIFTTNTNFVNTYTTKDSRIKLHQPVARRELLKTLSSFQFVVNFSNFGTAQTPSKLIDYVLIEKPILQIEMGNFNKKAVSQFLEGNYEKQVVITNPEQYRIEEVVNKFLNICG
jgi:hypothetical protein